MTGLPSPTGFTQTTGLSIGLGMSLGYGLAFQGFTSWTPAALFANGEPGGWYDPSDMTTLFQDAAGTTLVTGVEQPVGLILDKSKGLVLGSELVTNGDFSSSADWTLGAGWTISGGVLNGATGAFSEAWIGFTTVAGATYKVTLTMTRSAGNILVYISNGNNVSLTAPGTYTVYLVAGSSGSRLSIGGQTFTGTIDNVSVKLIPGNHASQSTSTSRPVLSARINLLTYTEQFDNAAWTKENNGSTTAYTLVDNSTSGRHIVYQTLTGDFAVSRKFSVEAKQNTLRYLAMSVTSTSDVNCYSAIFDLQTGETPVTKTNGTGTVSASIEPLGDGWYLCSITGIVASSGSSSVFPIIGTSDRVGFTGTLIQNNFPSYSGTGKSLFIRKADLRPSNAGVSLPAYQRVADAATYDTTGFPAYLKFDGTDDFLQSSTITPGSVDKAQVFAGVRKLSDATLGMLAEYGPNVNGTPGTWGHILPDTTSAGSLGLDLRGNGSSGIQRVSTGTAPATFVSATGFDLSGTTYETERPTKRVNGAAATVLSSAGATDTGEGNFSSQALYVGRRGGTTLPFNGHLYSLILRFSAANLDAATIASTETWVNSKTRAY